MSNRQELALSNTLTRKLRDDELDFIVGGINAKFDELESNVNYKQAEVVQRLDPLK